MKRVLVILIVSVILFNCSNGSGNDVMVKPPVENEKPVAVNDNGTTIEDDQLIINLLSNDTVITGASITSFDQTTANGATIVDNRDGTFTYSPANSFVGTDTFNYTLCDNDTTPDCSTAVVTIIVTDEGSPSAANDQVNTVKNTMVIIDNYAQNDSTIDDATIDSIDSSSSSGTVTINSDGTISYTPQTDFIGNDSFTYTICDDDTPSATCATATITVSVLDAISFNVPASLSSYYSNLFVTTDASLNYTLISDHTTDKHTTILFYSERHSFLYDADEDAANPANVILMYTGESRDEREYTSGNNSHSPQTFNTEHVYPQSRLTSDDAVTDLHHLRSTDAGINSERSNYPFVTGTGTYQLINNNSWYPGDEWRGDVARMIMYLNVRYGETFDKVGTLDLFLEWNAADPVSPFELQRNTVIQGAQGNRNPFIDNPYLATLIWGGTPAENRWE
jgi:endonuclease I